MLRPGSSPRPNAPSVARPASTTSTAITTSSPAAVGSGRSRKLRRWSAGASSSSRPQITSRRTVSSPTRMPRSTITASAGSPPTRRPRARSVGPVSAVGEIAQRGRARSPRIVTTTSTGVITPSITPAIAMPESFERGAEHGHDQETDERGRELRDALVQPAHAARRAVDEVRDPGEHHREHDRPDRAEQDRGVLRELALDERRHAVEAALTLARRDEPAEVRPLRRRPAQVDRGEDREHRRASPRRRSRRAATARASRAAASR